MKDLLDAKENDEHVLDFAFHQAHLILGTVIWDFSIKTLVYGLCVLPRKLV
jgi:hypothetical protein